MLFRSISRHVKEQNWTAIGIDFVIVVLGVFMGVQVDRWYQDSKALDKGHEYLQSIALDLNADIQAVESRRVFWRDVSDYGDAAISYLEAGKLSKDSAWKTLLSFYHASQMWRFSITNTTYLEMRSSGNLDLISNRQLRRELVDYYVSTERLAPELFAHNPAYRETIRGLVDSKIQDYIWSECYRQEDYQQWLLDCDSPIDEEKALEMLQVLKRNPQMTGQLRFWNRNLKITSVVVQATRQRAEKLLGKLSASD